MGDSTEVNKRPVNKQMYDSMKIFTETVFHFIKPSQFLVIPLGDTHKERFRVPNKEECHPWFDPMGLQSEYASYFTNYVRF